MTAERIDRLWPPPAAAIDTLCAGSRLRVAAAAAVTDHRLHRALPDPCAEFLTVIAAVGPQLGRDDPTLQQRVKQRQQLPALVLVARADPHRKRRPGRVDDQVETAARAAAERAADRAAPFFASTSDASTIARDQSLNPSASNRSCTRTSSCSHTPARRHS